ncbi:MAG: Gfo/Idh/MocA family oxidoreductase, partial [Planctomycetaceae bacterium]|nr:Gfo/Idh/MocA family oxidoreductase [Planctomycetaceae bacterium]
ANTRSRHIPGFRAIEGVEIAAVANRTEESTRRVAEEYSIPKTYGSWQELVADPDLDAVMIGTWPSLHAEITVAALEAGRHVLTEARMARSLAEAKRMAAAAEARPELITQIVPSPFGLEEDAYLKELIGGGFLGELREVVLISATDLFHDRSAPLHWRQEEEISGRNVLSLGILHETLLRWVPPPVWVMAQHAMFQTDFAPSPHTGHTEATVPDSVQILTRLEGGARGLYHLSGQTLFGPGHQIHLYGSRGTIRFELAPEKKLLIGQEGDEKLREVKIPAEQQGGWRVEEEFIGAIRGEEQVQFTDFATGLKYMEFTEAVAISAESQQAVVLPMP